MAGSGHSQTSGHCRSSAEGGDLPRELHANSADLLSAVVGSKNHLSFRKLRVVMATAFERFDKDGDGHICVEEFASSYDIRLGWVLLRNLVNRSYHNRDL